MQLIYTTAPYQYNENYSSSCFMRPLEISTTMHMKCLTCSLSHRKSLETMVIIMDGSYTDYIVGTYI